MDTWQIDVAHSAINFSVRHLVISKVRGRFAAWTAALEMDPADPTRSRVRATIDAASIDTGVADRDTHLRSADFFDVANFPELTFVGSRIEDRGDGRFRLTGDLTIRGTTREVTLDVEQGGVVKDPWGNQRAGFSAKGRIERKDFGLTWNMLLEAGGVAVGDRIDIDIEVEAVRQSAAAAA